MSSNYSFLRILSLIMFFLPVLSVEAFAGQLKVTWEVVQPFRFFRFPSHHAVQEWAWQEAQDEGVSPTHIVSRMESKLNSVAWWDGKPLGSTKSRKEMLDDLRRAEAPDRPFVAFDPRLGWASALRTDVNMLPSSGTCWNQDAKSHRGCLSSISQLPSGNSNNYVMPERHMVKLAVLEETATGWMPYEGECLYSLSVSPKIGYGFIDDPIRSQPEKAAVSLAACSEPLYLRTEYRTAYPLSVYVPAHEMELQAKVDVRDILVVGLGDSFASGEGNPEIPAALDEAKGISPYISVSSRTGNAAASNMIIPSRRQNADGRIDRLTAARWLDNACHRSIYSAQARTAIALAFEGARHHAVTYISFACSGAEITDGLFWPQDHRECGPSAAAGARFYQPQVSAVVDALSSGPIRRGSFGMRLAAGDRFLNEVVSPFGGDPRKFRKDYDYCSSWPSSLSVVNPPVLRLGSLDREIDLLLLSIGGNDVGFGRLISSAVINSTFFDMHLPAVRWAIMRLYKSAAGAIGIAEAERRIDALPARFEMLQQAISQKFEIKDPSRVVVTAYPRLSIKSRSAASSSAAVDYCGSGNMGMNVSKLLATINSSAPNTVTAKTADGFIFKLNKRISDISLGYGWRVASAHVERFVGHSYCSTTSVVNGPVAKLDTLDIPHKLRGASASRWRPFNPAREFYPYESRERWVRTFNDAYLLANYYKRRATDEDPLNSNPGLHQAQRALGGAMHPTAEGHANIADGILIEARKVLFSGSFAQHAD